MLGHVVVMWQQELRNMENKIQKPTVGRVVHVFGNWEAGVPRDTPRVALVAGVVDGLRINVALFAHNGDTMLGGVQGLPHRSEVAEHAAIFWDWMDYQKGQAAKTEALESELQRMAKPIGRSADDSLNDLHKTQASAPSPVDGKR